MLSLFAILIGIYLLLAGAVFLGQASLLYFPSHDFFAAPDRIGLSYESVRFKTADDLVLDGWYIPGDPYRETILFFHGNAGNITHRLDSLKIFNELGLNVFIFDYRGYGQSQGLPSEEGTDLDADAALAYLTRTRQIPHSQIIYFGRSLGGAIAAKLASRSAPKMLIIESTFTSVPDLAAEIYWFLPVRWLSRFRYDAKKYLASIDSPTLIIHSRDDEIIGIRHGRALYASASGPKDFLEIRGDHNSGFLIDGNRYKQGLQAFLQKYR